MNSPANNPNPHLRPIDYWWLWVLDTVLVAGGFLFFLATRYGTYEFFGKACAMALLPLIPVLVLVGGAGSTVFALTKVWIEKRGWKKSAGLALLVGPALALALSLGLLCAFKSPAHWLAYICVGHAPASVSEVQITGYSAFLREEWLAVFHTDEKSFQMLVAEAKLAPVDGFFFQRTWEQSSLKATQLGRSLPPPPAGAACFQRVFKESTEHERGSVLAFYDPLTSTAVILRQYRD